MSTTDPKADRDPLLEEIAALREADPSPALSGVAKAAIIEAAAANAPADDFLTQLKEQLAQLMRPVAMATLSIAAIAGVSAGALVPSTYADNTLTPEEELIAYYEQSLWEGSDASDVEAGEAM
jgi:hypothetical protein